MARKKNVKKKVETFFELFDEIKQLASEKRNASTEADRELSGVYHKIEGTVIKHVSQSHNLIKELKDVLERRRTLKMEDAMLRSIVDQLGSQMGNAKKSNVTILKKHDDVVEEIRVRAKE